MRDFPNILLSGLRHTDSEDAKRLLIVTVGEKFARK
jgi:hypothetical protein